MCDSFYLICLPLFFKDEHAGLVLFGTHFLGSSSSELEVFSELLVSVTGGISEGTEHVKAGEGTNWRACVTAVSVMYFTVGSVMK